jgi:hypothetical protein
MKSPDTLSVSQLKSALKHCVRVTKERMAPLLYYLRQRLKKQGSRSGEGFGAWVSANLPFTRRTADLWANEWAEAKGLRTPTFRNISKSALVPSRRLSPDDPYPLSLSFSPDRRQEFEEAALALDPEELEQVIFDAVTEAAHRKRKGKARKAAAGR